MNNDIFERAKREINLFKNIIEGNVEGFSSEFLEFLVKNLTLIK